MVKRHGTVNPFGDSQEFISDHLKDSFLSEHYYHVSLVIEWTWGSIECLSYLERITAQDDREVLREGFKVEAFYELRQLLELHRNQFPEIKTKEPDIWVGVSHRGMK